MEETQRDVICPKCGSRHGPAARECECGHGFEAPDREFASPLVYFGVAVMFFATTVMAGDRLRENGFLFIPIGSLFAGSLATAYGVKAWLCRLRKK